MSQETFERVGAFKRGYDPDEVDDFLVKAKRAYSLPPSEDFDADTVVNATFSRVRRGYRPDLVDAALDRLATAFIQRQRKQTVSRLGENTWLNKTYDLAKTLYPRILRPAGERFRDAKGWGYDKDEVDKLLDRLAEFFDGKTSMTAMEIRQTTFSGAKNAGAYDYDVVDVYLDRAAQVLTSVE
ncbi:MAG: DivIVA domain-containing protein [Actinomycetaceae bacterium]|nr:DivIVA domain-containing protein [Actinomycetaceae bacterium]